MRFEVMQSENDPSDDQVRDGGSVISVPTEPASASLSPPGGDQSADLLPTDLQLLHQLSIHQRDRVKALVLFLLLAIVLCTNAWVVDDAYITFRTVENFVNGRGLTWNPEERVQVYTHPLWMFVVSCAYAVTHEFFITVVALSIFLTLAAVLIASATMTNRLRDDTWKGWILILFLMASKASLDYASSGLENCMTYLIAAIFLSQFMRISNPEQIGIGKLFSLFFLAALAFMNRADTLLLFSPALLYALYVSRHLPKRRLALAIFIATIPATGWILFSLVYYGYPSPNTAYAKVICTGYPFDWKLTRGIGYWMNSLRWDSASWLILASAVYFALKRKSWTALTLLAGVAIYIGFVVVSAAAATHMSGRFFAVPLFIAAILFAHGAPSRRFAEVVCACLVVCMVLNPISAIKFGTPLYRPLEHNMSFVDIKWFVAEEGAALLNWRPGKKMPDHEWIHYGEELKSLPEEIFVGGALGGEAIGYTAFAAGPSKHFIDIVALSDPLLSKLPALRPPNIEEWKSGHFHRPIPAGYIESIASGGNHLSDPGLREYYEHVRTITRGPIWDWKRFVVIANMNLGSYEYLLAQAKEEIQDARTIPAQ